MAITTAEAPPTEFGASVADLGAWAKGIATMSALADAYDEMAESAEAGTKALIKGTQAATKMTSSAEMLSGALLAGATSFDSLIQATGTMALMALGLPAPLAAVGGKILSAAKGSTVWGYSLGVVSKGLGLVKRTAVTLGKVGLAAFKKLATLGVAALKKLAKFGIAAFKKLAKLGIAAVKKLAQFTVAAFKKILIGVAALGAGLLALPVFLDKLFQKVMTGAAKLEGIRAAFYATSAGAAEMFAALKKGSSGMVEDVDLMAQYNSALLLVSKTFADTLPDALGYLTKISLATGEDMDYLIDSYVRGVGRLSSKILDNLKIQVTMAEAVAWASAEFGKAADQLTVYEKQQGFAAVAMEKLRAKTAHLADVTGSLTHLMAVFNVQQAENSRLLANIFLPVAKSFYKVMIKIQEMFRASISEGGKYYNVLRKLSAGFAGLIEAVGELVTRFSTGGSEAVDAFADKMFKAAWNAFEWGANIINNLAIGIARGITTTLMTVINMLSNFLGYWLSPGSAPNIVPHLLAWGASAFTEYLRGFTMADFGILTGLQAPLEGALSNLVALGTITDEQAHEMFINVSEAMAQAIATGDLEGAMAQLVAVGGEYGAELAELFKRQLAVADATKAVEDAQRRLTAARNLEEATGKRLSREARDYNRLLREGASEEVLAAKLAEMKATYATLEGARDAAEVAEDDKKLAEERLKVQQELMQVQSALLQQLIKMGQAFAAIGDGDGDGDWLPDPDEILPPFGEIIGGIDQAFEDLKNGIRDKFLALWADLEQDWIDSDVGKMVEQLKQTWKDSKLKEWWDEFIFDVKEEGLRAALENLWLKLETTTQNFLDEKYPAWGNVWRAFTQKGLEDGSGQVEFMPALASLWVDVIAPGIQKWLDRHESWWADVWASFTGTGVRDGSGDVDLTEAFDELWRKLGEKLIVLTGAFGESLGSLLADAFVAVFFDVEEDQLGTKEGGFWRRLGTSFAEGIAQGFKDGVFEQEPEFYVGWQTLFAFFTGWGGVKSASTKFAGLGRDFVLGLVQGMNEKIGEVSWSSMAETVKNAFVTGLSGIGDAIKGALNSVIATVERGIDHIITGVNNLIYAIGLATGAWVPYLSYIDFPRLEQGGLITATQQLAVLHQHEVVLPLKDPRTINLMADAMRGAFGQIRDADAAPVTQVHIEMNFGRDSIRSDRDITEIANQLQRKLELQGVRGGIQ